MVLAEKNNETTTSSRNGRRSRGPSPNGQQLVDTSSEDESTVPVDKIRVGRDYQATCPELQPEVLRKPELIADRALLVWSPTALITDMQLEDYIVLAKDKYGYNGEQALGMLFWHKHDLERAVLDLANFTPFPDEWSVEDKVLFEQAFQFHGKSFHRIRQMLPDKSIASLVKYYYGWKKTRSRTSLMDKQARKLQSTAAGKSAAAGADDAAATPAPSAAGEHKNASDPNSANDDSDHEDKKWTIHRGIRRKSRSPLRPGQTVDENSSQGEKNGGSCSNCGVCCTYTHTTPKGSMCNSCYLHWRRTGVLRPTHGPTPGIKRLSNGGNSASTASGVGGQRNLAARHKRRPPKGMYMNHDDVAAMASQGAGLAMLKALTRQQDALQRQIQQNKQMISSLKRKHSSSIEDLRLNVDISAKVCNKWSGEEQLLGVEALRKYGKDWKAISDVLGNKTEQHVRAFYGNYRKKYCLDSIVREWQNNHKSPVSIFGNTNKNRISINNGTSIVKLETSSLQAPQEKQLTIPSIDITSDNEDNSEVTCISPSPTHALSIASTPTPSRIGRELKSNGKMASLQTLQVAK